MAVLHHKIMVVKQNPKSNCLLMPITYKKQWSSLGINGIRNKSCKYMAMNYKDPISWPLCIATRSKMVMKYEI